MMANLDDQSTDNITEKEKEDCAEYICETINNMSVHLNEKSKQCRYSPHILNICLAVYSRSKAGYEELKDSGLLPLPSASTLKRLTQPFKIKEGFDPKVGYLLNIKNEISKHGTPIRGHLMMDEIKLKNCIMRNCMNNVIT